VIDLGDEFIATVEEERLLGDSFALAGAGRSAPPRDEFPAAVEEEKPAGLPPQQPERPQDSSTFESLPPLR